MATGSITRLERYRVMRAGQPVGDGLFECTSIRRHRLDVDTVGKGTECGVMLGLFQDFKPGDMLQCVRKARRQPLTRDSAQ